MYSVFFEKPMSFDCKLSVSACYMEYQGRYLFLKRSPSSSQGNTWGVPAGKVKKGETALQAVIREIFEETQVTLVSQKTHEVGKLWIEIPCFQYKYFLFSYKLSTAVSVKLNHENSDFKWCTFEEAQDLKLMMGAKEALIYFKKISNQDHGKQ